MNYQPSDLVPQIKIAKASVRTANAILDFAFFSWIYIIWKEYFFKNFLEPVIPELHMTGEALMIIFLCFIYYSLFEYGLGKTPAKWLTKTSVVDVNGRPPTLAAVLLRNAFRFIPLNPFSILGNEPVGLHDALSATRVWNNYYPKNSTPSSNPNILRQDYTETGKTKQENNKAKPQDG